LPDNWDGEGAKAYEKATWERAAEFIKLLAYHVWKKNQKIITIPRFLPGPDGSIDIHWKVPTFDLLINIPESPSEPATFAADDYGKNSAKGTFDLRKMNQMLVYWLVEFT